MRRLLLTLAFTLAACVDREGRLEIDAPAPTDPCAAALAAHPPALEWAQGEVAVVGTPANAFQIYQCGTVNGRALVTWTTDVRHAADGRLGTIGYDESSAAPLVKTCAFLPAVDVRRFASHTCDACVALINNSELTLEGSECAVAGDVNIIDDDDELVCAGSVSWTQNGCRFDHTSRTVGAIVREDGGSCVWTPAIETRAATGVCSS